MNSNSFCLFKFQVDGVNSAAAIAQAALQNMHKKVKIITRDLNSRLMNELNNKLLFCGMNSKS